MLLEKQAQNLDTRLFKAFLAAAEAENFTTAAQSVYMTQSGISQHIAKLEAQLGVPLFKRIGRRVTLTEAGVLLQRFIKQHTHSTESFLDAIRGSHSDPAGLVSYAMPASCLLSPHFAMLLQERKRHPGIRLRVILAASDEVLRLVLTDAVDFGFVTRRSDHPQLEYRLFCQEEYVLIGADQAQLGHLDPAELTKAPLITYPGFDVYFDSWFRYHHPDQMPPDLSTLEWAGDFSSIDGAIKMVEGGLGMTVIPRHCVMQQLEDGRLFERPEQKPPLQNAVYIATIKDHAYSRAVTQVIDWFMAMHADE